MKKKTFKSGHYTCHTYLKSVGHGWETGFVFNSKTIFVGNFVHQKEATQWYSMMNREITHFARKYTVGTKFPVTWFSHFITNHLYKTYYAFLDKLFTHHNRVFTRAVTRDVRKYKQLKKTWTSKRVPFLKAA